MLRSKIYSSSLMHEQLDSLLGGPEGVRLDSARANGERIYDLGGRQLSAPVKGVNIIYGQKYVRSDQKIFVIRGIANGLETELTFKRIGGKWKLVKLII